MNVVFLSPHFPPNFKNFSIRLREAGANVLGLGDPEFDALPDDLRSAMTEYYRVDNLQDYDQLVRALGYFTHRFGKIDRIDSLNEFWLETEARLRTDFNIPGIKIDQIEKIKRKSAMKQVYEESGLNPGRGRICSSEKDVRDFIKEVGFPVVAKPDIGVGAAKTYKLQREADIKFYLSDKLPVDYIVEEFITGQIVTFDGLTDTNGDLVFSSSLRYSKGIMEVVNEDSDVYYYAVRDIEPEIQKIGLKTLKAFDVREKFFHFEYFWNDDGDLTPLEVNIRPPGGLTVDMFNFAFNFDCFRAWADVITTGCSERMGTREFHVMYISKKNHIAYHLNHEQVMAKFPDMLVHYEPIQSVFARALGDHGYILRHRELEPLLEAAATIHRRAFG